MRLAVLALTVAACSSAQSLVDAGGPADGPSASASADAPSPCAAAACDPHATCSIGDGPTCTCDPGYAGDGHTCTAVAVSLEGLRWEIPCGAAADSVSCFVTDPPVQTATLSGIVDTTYQVDLRFRGVVEQKTYSGGTPNGYFYTGGAENGDTYNVYSLQVSAPAQIYFLNAGSSAITNCWALDYTATIQMTAGATVTLTASAKDGREIANRDANGTPLVVNGVPPAPAAFDGQFIQMDVVSVTAP